MIVWIAACSSWPGAEPAARVTPDPRMGAVIADLGSHRVMDARGSSADAGGFISYSLAPGYDGERLDGPGVLESFTVSATGEVVALGSPPVADDATLESAWSLDAQGALVATDGTTASVHVYDNGWTEHRLPDAWRSGDPVWASTDGTVFVQVEQTVWVKTASLDWQTLPPNRMPGGWHPDGFTSVWLSQDGTCAEDVALPGLTVSNQRCTPGLFAGPLSPGFSGDADGFHILGSEGTAPRGVMRVLWVTPDAVVRGESLTASGLWTTPGSTFGWAFETVSQSPNGLPALHQLDEGMVIGHNAMPPQEMALDCSCDRNTDPTCDCLYQTPPSVYATVTDDAVLWVSVDAVDGRRNLRARWLDLPLHSHPFDAECPEACPVSCTTFEGGEPMCPASGAPVVDDRPVTLQLDVLAASTPDVPVNRWLIPVDGSEPIDLTTNGMEAPADSTFTLELSNDYYSPVSIGPFTTAAIGSTLDLGAVALTRGLRIGDQDPVSTGMRATAVHPGTQTLVTRSFGWHLVAMDNAVLTSRRLTFGAQTIGMHAPVPVFSTNGEYVVTGGWSGQVHSVASATPLVTVNGSHLPRLTRFSADDRRILLHEAESVTQAGTGGFAVVDPVAGVVVLEVATDGAQSSLSGDGSRVARIEDGDVVLYDVATGTAEVLPGFPTVGPASRTAVTNGGVVFVVDVPLGGQCERLNVDCPLWRGASGVPAVQLDPASDQVYASPTAETAISEHLGALTFHDLVAGTQVLAGTGGEFSAQVGETVVSAGLAMAAVSLVDGTVVEHGLQSDLTVLDDGSVVVYGSGVAGRRFLRDGTVQTAGGFNFGPDGRFATSFDNGTQWLFEFDPQTSTQISREAITDGSVAIQVDPVYGEYVLGQRRMPLGAPCLVYQRSSTTTTANPPDGGVFCAYPH